MAPNFSKNAILEGSVDNFCLVCEIYLASKEETLLHISNIKHQEILNTIQYVEDFKEDCIKKIKGKYFCEYCNKSLPILPRVQLHINDSVHKDKKSHSILKRKSDYVIAFDQFVINDQSWNGLHDNSCALCEEEYEDEKQHKTKANHIINVIQSKVEFDKNRNVYRKIDDFSFYCLTCNKPLAFASMTSHFEGKEHKNEYQKCCEAFKKIENLQTMQSNELKVVDKNILKVENKSDKDTCNSKSNNICNKTSLSNQPEVKVSKENIVKDIIKTKSTLLKSDEYVFDDKWEDDISAVLNTVDYVTEDEKGSTWCVLCNWTMDPVKSLGHVLGEHHNTILRLHKNHINMLKKRYSQKNAMKNLKDNADMLNSVNEFQKNGIDINFELNVATCKKCSVNLQFNCEAISKHIKEHNITTPKEEKEQVPFPSGIENVKNKRHSLLTSPVHIKSDNENIPEAKSFENSNKELTQIQKLSNSKDNETSFSLDVIKKNKRNVMSKVPMKDFVKKMSAFENSIFKDLVINEKFVLNYLSFSFIVLEKSLLKCVMCNESLAFEGMLKHLETLHHNLALKESLLYIFQTLEEKDGEFIREIRNGKFHCGFCNAVVASWDNMLEHLETSFHRESKNSSYWRLTQYKPQLALKNFQEQIEETFMAEMFMRKFL